MRGALLLVLASGTAAASPLTTAEDLFYGTHGSPFDPKKSFPMAKAACDAGDAFGCSLLGFHYQDGSGVAWSPELAVAAYTKACRLGSGVGCYNLAGMYGGGHGVDVDNAKYESFLEKAGAAWRKQCDGGDYRWCSNSGFYAETRRDFTVAVADYQRGCDHANKVSCVEAARVRYQQAKGPGAVFVREIDRLCTDGEVIACGMLASFLATGERDIAKDEARSVTLRKRACEMNDGASCAALGFAHVDGKSVPQDFAAAERYFRLACDRRVSGGCMMLARRSGTPAALAEAPALARRACEMNEADGCEMLALSSTTEAEIVKWAREGCRRGRYSACMPLVDRDLPIPAPADKKAKLYKDACAEGHKAACKQVH